MRELDGRWISALMIVVYFGVLFSASWLLHRHPTDVWWKLGVPALPQHFVDFRAVALGADRFMASEHRWSPESIAYGVSAYNYTRWWLLLGYLGLSVKTAVGFVMGIIFFFLVSVFYILGKLSLEEGIMGGLVLVSPNVMTGIERGNGDLLIFILMTMALALRKIIPLSGVSMIMAALLKIYPTATLLVLFHPPWRKTLPWLILAVGAIAANLWLSLHEYQAIGQNAPRWIWFSFGSTTLALEIFHMGSVTALAYEKLLAGCTVLFLLVLGLSAWICPAIQMRPEWEKEIYAFKIGALLYIGTYAMGTNYDYRTMMLIFCLPLLFRLVDEPGSTRWWSAHWWSTLALAMIVIDTSWRFLTASDRVQVFYVKQGVAWALVILLTGILVRTIRWPWERAPLSATASD